jgi:hypothetical protein
MTNLFLRYIQSNTGVHPCDRTTWKRYVPSSPEMAFSQEHADQMMLVGIDHDPDDRAGVSVNRKCPLAPSYFHVTQRQSVVLNGREERT